MKTVLIIEDDPIQLTALSGALSEHFRVLTAPDGKAGWNSIIKEHPDLVLLDIMLPGGMNGFELLDQLRREPGVMNTPVIVLTNLDNESETLKKTGVTDYLVKANTSITDITAKIQAILQ